MSVQYQHVSDTVKHIVGGPFGDDDDREHYASKSLTSTIDAPTPSRTARGVPQSHQSLYYFPPLSAYTTSLGLPFCTPALPRY